MIYYSKTNMVMLGQMWNITRRLVIANNKTKRGYNKLEREQGIKHKR